jgi:hypothetical protein
MGLTPTDFDGLAGAPFVQAEIDAAVFAVQAAARWHIAPEVTEDVILDVGVRDPTLRLPTRKLGEVNTITDLVTSEVISDTLYRVSLGISEVRKNCGFWPSGVARIKVNMTHGFDDCPLDLLPTIAQFMTQSRRDQSVKLQGAGPFRVAYNDGTGIFTKVDNPFSATAILDAYALYWTGL